MKTTTQIPNRIKTAALAEVAEWRSNHGDAVTYKLTNLRSDDYPEWELRILLDGYVADIVNVTNDGRIRGF